MMTYLDRMKIETLRCKFPMRWEMMGDSDDDLDYNEINQRMKHPHLRRSPWVKNDGNFARSTS